MTPSGTVQLCWYCRESVVNLSVALATSAARRGRTTARSKPAALVSRREGLAPRMDRCFTFISSSSPGSRTRFAANRSRSPNPIARAQPTKVGSRRMRLAKHPSRASASIYCAAGGSHPCGATWYRGRIAHDTEVKAVLRAYQKALDALQRLDRSPAQLPQRPAHRTRGRCQQGRACPRARRLPSASRRDTRPRPSRARRRRRGRDRLGVRPRRLVLVAGARRPRADCGRRWS